MAYMLLQLLTMLQEETNSPLTKPRHDGTDAILNGKTSPTHAFVSCDSSVERREMT